MIVFWFLGSLNVTSRTPHFPSFLWSHNTLFLMFHHLTVPSYFLLASEKVFSNGYSTTGFLQQCVIPVQKYQCVMSTRRILCSGEMLESFSPNEKLPGKCVKMNTRKVSAISSHHSQGRVRTEDGGACLLLFWKLRLLMINLQITVAATLY